MNYKSIFENVQEQGSFIKTTVKPVIDGPDKAALNRKGTVLYNSGDIEGARRIFLTTGNTTGLTRVGDYYNSKGRSLDALRMYWIAPDRRKAEPIIEKLASLIQNMLHTEGGI